MARGHNPIWISTLTCAAGDLVGRCKPSLWGAGTKPHENFGYFIDSSFSHSLSMHHLMTKKTIFSYPIIARKRPMSKQSIKTINAEFILICALSQLFFIQVRPYEFHSVQTFFNLVSKVSSLFDGNIKK